MAPGRNSRYCRVMNEPQKTDEPLGKPEQRFIKSIQGGSRPKHAARRAGFARPTITAEGLMQREEVQAQIKDYVDAVILGEGAVAAAKCLTEIVRNRKLDPKLRASCSKIVLSLAGFVPPKAPDPAAKGQKPIQAMSRSELLELAQRAQKELSDRAVAIVDASQPGAQAPPKPADILG